MVNDNAVARTTTKWRRLAFFKIYWKALVVSLAPFILLPIFLIDNTPANRCMYVVVLMITYWVTEAVPLAAASMLPIVLFPVFDIMTTSQVCMVYMKEPIVMFIAGIMIALAVEHCNLHTRVALKVVQIVGCSQRRLHFGLMLITMFLSMWISNTASTSMMCPIVLAVLEQLEAQGLCNMYEKSELLETSGGDIQRDTQKPSKITLCYMLGIAYATSIGGTGTLVGTGTNMAFKGILELEFPSLTVSFQVWMACVVVAMLLAMVFTFLWLQVLYMGLFRPKSKAAQSANIGKEGELVAKDIISKRYQQLGPISSHEIMVGLLFLLTILLFVTRRPGFVDGWADIINPTVRNVTAMMTPSNCPTTKAASQDYKIKDGTAAVFVLLLLFMMPSDWRFLNYFKRNPDDLPTQSGPALLPWKYAQARTPWNLIFLLGGGFAIADGGNKSGMSQQVGDSLNGLEDVHPLLLLLIVCVFIKILTEFTTNVSVANIAMPVLANMSKNFGICPMYLMLPATVMCSFAFHFPVGTPPNAIVAAKANIRNLDMLIGGIGPTVITFLCVVLFIPFWSQLLYPAEFNPSGYPECGV